jgi:hypothetical protein
VHIALNYTPWSLAPVLAHEMTHAMVAHLELPRWMDEGMAMAMEQQYGRDELLGDGWQRRHRSWPREAIQGFWAGTAFDEPETEKACYELARVAMYHLLHSLPRGRRREHFSALVRDARWTDAGDAAARRTLGRGVGELIIPFLGPGDWAPNQAAMVELWARREREAREMTGAADHEVPVDAVSRGCRTG